MLKAPNFDELKSMCDAYHLKITDQRDLKAFRDVIEASMDSFNFVNDYPLELDPFPYQITNNRRPKPEENPYNAWAWFCDIRGSGSEGLLHGKTLAVKDNVAVPNVPMMNGSRTMEDFVPEYAASIVTKCLAEGVRIKGKATCEDLCLSGSSFNTTNGPVKNPWNPERSAGGSSSGSAVVVCCGDADLATGGDQAGSVRIPSSNCGLVGLKPTYGLVPYTGAVPIEMTMDHIGPMARTVEDAARLLEAMAGYDHDKDSRQPSTGFTVPSYTKLLQNPIKPMKIGVLGESFLNCQNDVVECVREAVKLLKGSPQFPVVEEISIPMHSHGLKIWNAIGAPGLINQMIDGHGYGTGSYGYLPYTLSERLKSGLASQAHHLSVSTKAFVLLGVNAKYGGWANTIYAKGQTLALKLRREYDRALQTFDLLLTPTLPHVAGPLPPPTASTEEKLEISCTMLSNTSPFNVTHHPAITLNCGYSKQVDPKKPLPVGLQLIGKRWDEPTLLAGALAVEKILAPIQLPFPV